MSLNKEPVQLNTNIKNTQLVSGLTNRIIGMPSFAMAALKPTFQRWALAHRHPLSHVVKDALPKRVPGKPGTENPKIIRTANNCLVKGWG